MKTIYKIFIAIAILVTLGACSQVSQENTIEVYTEELGAVMLIEIDEDHVRVMPRYDIGGGALLLKEEVEGFREEMLGYDESLELGLRGEMIVTYVNDEQESIKIIVTEGYFGRGTITEIQ